jgi:ubiquinone/menaquinone biosynthesis C-methylase UbiE
VNWCDGAVIPTDVRGVLTRRTLANSHPTLLSALRPGMSVLDVGCGPGTLTIEIARRVDPGSVVGMDRNPDMIRAAQETVPPGTRRNLVFCTGDILEGPWDGEFDLVNATRTLQWIRDAGRALRRMAQATVHGGTVTVLDYDHTMAAWNDPPKAWRRFYDAFLAWREAGGLDNALARRLSDLCRTAGLLDVSVTPQIATVRAGDADFFRVAGQWRMVIESRGRQMVAAGHLAESDRRAALAAFTEWMQEPGATQTVYEACLVARRP